jgi:hypothetical protein
MRAVSRDAKFRFPETFVQRRSARRYWRGDGSADLAELTS